IMSAVNFVYGLVVLPESLPAERRRPFNWRRANPLGTLMQMRTKPMVVGVLLALFCWSLANQVMPSTWSFYSKFRFHWNTATLVGMAIGTVTYAGFGIGSAGWMMFAWLLPWYFAAIVFPTASALMSHRVGVNEQGELQGAVASLFSLSAIVGPPIFTQLFGRF